jgi:hypothetical protein
VKEICQYNVNTVDNSNVFTGFTLITDSFSEGSKVTCGKVKEKAKKYLLEILTLDPLHDIRVVLESISPKPIRDDIKKWADQCHVNE